MKKRVTIYYHSADADGWSSAALLYFYLTKNYIDISQIDEDDEVEVKCKFWNYGFIYREDYRKEDLIILADIHFPEDEMKKIIDKVGSGNVLILDHHESAFEMFKSMKNELHPQSVFNDSSAACLHTYNFVKNNLRDLTPRDWKERLNNIEILYHLFNWWDSFTFRELDGSNGFYPKDPIYINYYMNNVGAEFYTQNGSMFWDNIFELAQTQEGIFEEINQMLSIGEILYQSYQKQNTLMIRAYSFDVEFEGYEMLCINTLPGQGSMFFEEHPEVKKYDLVCNFYYTPKKDEYSFSIYSMKDDIDLLPVWKKYNNIRSGGHKGAGSIRSKDFKYDRLNRKLEFVF